jgi:hypothetical protein
MSEASGLLPLQEVSLIVIASSATSSRAHLFPNVKALIAAVEVFTAAGATTLRMEFFDPAGVRLHPVFGPHWQLTGLQPGPDPADPELLLNRLRGVVKDIEQALLNDDEAAQALEELRMTPKEAVAQLPHLDGVGLTEGIRRCHTAFGHSDADPGNNGSPLHNLFVHGII